MLFYSFQYYNLITIEPMSKSKREDTDKIVYSIIYIAQFLIDDIRTIEYNIII